ncbi:hypothetical protein BX616_008496 [Lobosporangium transversale]|uniref:Pre-rRNA processing protein n=1 Tax=Lobosporangium transversale TaxID=64571 RepID=A0A1Y2GMP6_9FUNG|nr:hypothetical protein BCR41DRAFT_422018 [Lobosporangium transversale]KAF9914339.1 hypothetical protein BX616_008496 [Lobosporangium transversale]ORZ15987.1 hypothetical protein BCR41DRAFT_422018 [Lobosporangium transversale]|eukprot:XP_021881334.1 hypothetical protein BCR41DRAFT_422018 [Lobosporangium transversale]
MSHMLFSASKEKLAEKDHHQNAGKISSDEDLPYGSDEVEYNDEKGEFDTYDEEHGHAAEKRTRFYQSKRFWIKCITILVIILAVFIPLLIFVILPKLVQAIVNGSTMSMSQLNMTDATETGMKVSLIGGIDNAGIFPATIEFPEPIIVSWEGHQLGSMQMSSVKASGGKATIIDSTSFSIIDKEAFSTFAKDMLTIETFTWVLTSTVQVKAIGRTIKDISLKKELKMLGMNGFGKVTIDSFTMPGDAPNNAGAYVRLVTSMNNPSPIGMTLGTMVLDLFYEGTYLGQVTATDAVLIGNSPSPLTLEGLLFYQTNQTDLDNVSTLMSNFLAGKVTMTSAKGVAVKPDGINSISWLSNGLLSLTLNVPLQSPTPLNVIRDISIKDMGMIFNETSPYTPTASSNMVTAGFKLPFNITVGMQSVSNSMSILYKGKVLTDINAAVWSQAQSDVPGGLIVFSLPPSLLVVKDDAKEEFDQFIADLTVNAEQTFMVTGLASAVSTTPVGTVKLSGIPFTSNVTMKGLNFNSIDAAVTNVVVNGGTSDHITMNQMVALPNPSTLSVTGGSVLLTVYDKVTDQYLGELSIPNLKVVPGPNPTPSQFFFHPKNETLRDQFLSQYLTGAVFPLKVVGSKKATSIVELKAAMSLVSISSTAPGLTPPRLLVTSGTANSNIGTLLGNRQTITSVNMINPLNTELYVTGQVTQISWKGNFFGTINAKYEQAVPPNGAVDTPPLTLQHPSGLEFGFFLTTQFVPSYPLIALGGAMVPFDLDVMMSVRVGGPNGYPATIHYVQQQEILTKMSMF